MRRCFVSIFDVALAQNIKSLTIPPIGTGFYGFHMYEYTIICFRIIAKFLNANPQIEQITLITNSKLQYSYYNVILNDYIRELS